jgi:hypothetical protein
MAEGSSPSGITSASSADTGQPPPAVSTLIDRLCAAQTPDPAFDEAITAQLTEAESPGTVAAEELYEFLLPVLKPGAVVAFGPYRVVGILGTGGMGIVLQAEDPQLSRAWPSK